MPITERGTRNRSGPVVDPRGPPDQPKSGLGMYFRHPRTRNVGAGVESAHV